MSEDTELLHLLREAIAELPEPPTPSPALVDEVVAMALRASVRSYRDAVLAMTDITIDALEARQPESVT